jgi:hypothetical protein
MFAVAGSEGNEEFMFFDTVISLILLGQHDLIEVSGE